MSNSKRNTARVIGLLPTRVRQDLVRAYKPDHPMIYCHHVTYAYGVPKDQIALPQSESKIKVIGIYRDEKCDVLFVSVNGQPRRPDGKPFHITLSVAEDLPPAAALKRAANTFTPIPEGEVFLTRFQQARIQVDTPTLNPRFQQEAA